MNATKRKFNALLQGLSTPHEGKYNPSEPLVTNQQAQISNLVPKKRRLEAHGLPYSYATEARSLTQPYDTKSALNLGQPRAKYCPSDREELLKRLETYQEITQWTPKPERISEIEWAKRGWVCQGRERVRCVLCRKDVVVKLSQKTSEGENCQAVDDAEGESSNTETSFTDVYADMIVTSHQEDCLWRKRGCEDSLLRLSLANATTSLTNLYERYSELCSRKSNLPYEFNLKVPNNFNVDRVLSQLPCDFFHEASASGHTSQEVDRTAFTLAFFGWQGLDNWHIGAVSSSASCHTCYRRLGLWLFKSKEIGDDGKIITPAPMEFLDVVWEHRFFCPWKSAQAQSRAPEASSEPGWRLLTQALNNDAQLRSMYEGTKGGFALSPSRAKDGTSTHLRFWSEDTGTKNTSDDTLQKQLEDVGQDRETKDNARWARLRKVKSLFDSRGSWKTTVSNNRLFSRPSERRDIKESSPLITPTTPK